ncbi:hypothetical protein [Streptomyces sp. NPDC018031]|uniref:hypothetical protein n=1 Tax=Streptomyces sp. NPDC018031 TaxID=3365033 RepID=UPI0037903799
MVSSARHALPARSARSRALLRAGLVTAAGAALVAGGASAATADDGDKLRIRTPVKALDTTMVKGGEISGPAALTYAVAPLKNLQANPLAKTPADVTDNRLRARVADFRPVGTGAVTGPLSRGESVRRLPVVGEATTLLPG